MGEEAPASELRLPFKELNCMWFLSSLLFVEICKYQLASGRFVAVMPGIVFAMFVSLVLSHNPPPPNGKQKKIKKEESDSQELA